MEGTAESNQCRKDIAHQTAITCFETFLMFYDPFSLNTLSHLHGKPDLRVNTPQQVH